MKINGLSPELAKRLLEDKGYNAFASKINGELKKDGFEPEFPTAKELRTIIKTKIKENKALTAFKRTSRAGRGAVNPGKGAI